MEPNKQPSFDPSGNQNLPDQNSNSGPPANDKNQTIAGPSETVGQTGEAATPPDAPATDQPETTNNPAAASEPLAMASFQPMTDAPAVTTAASADSDQAFSSSPSLSSASNSTADSKDNEHSYLSAFLLTTTFLAIFGVRSFYSGDKVGGWIRLALGGGGIVLEFIGMLTAPVLAIIGGLMFIVAAVWAIIDFFYTFFALRSGKQGVSVSQSDRHWATFIFSLTIAAVVAYAVVSAFVFQSLSNSLDLNSGVDSSFDASFDSSLDSRPSSNSFKFQTD
ncbi:MAG TPA: hypothetical protein VFG56_02720 [Candidatus Saccharimonadales bacterium]|nr:hypothetical protein [Candidatus Saccharimonadales bacterium]